MADELTVVIAETQAMAEQYRSQRKPGGIRIAWAMKDLPARPCQVVKLGDWWKNPLAGLQEFYDWRYEYGDFRGAPAERKAAAQGALETFPGSVVGGL